MESSTIISAADSSAASSSLSSATSSSSHSTHSSTSRASVDLYSIDTGHSPLLRRPWHHANTNITNPSHQQTQQSNRCRLISFVLLLIRFAYQLILLLKLFLKFILIPWLFFHKKPYGDLDNVSLETVTIFLWLILIYMTIFVIIGIIGILDENLYLISCFLFLMDMEIVICLWNGYIDYNVKTCTLSAAVILLTSVYLTLVLVERRLLKKHSNEHPSSYV